MTDCKREFPKSWFARAKLSPGKRDNALNYFKVDASQPLAEWKRKGWLHKDDPRGWFQWYCRYYMGRRHEDDARQIKRWKAFRRHIGQIKAHCEQGRFLLPPPPAPGAVALGLRQPQDLSGSDHGRAARFRAGRMAERCVDLRRLRGRDAAVRSRAGAGCGRRAGHAPARHRMRHGRGGAGGRRCRSACHRRSISRPPCW